MRKSKTNQNLKVNAIAGTYVVTLGFNLPKEECKGLLGFSILRTDASGVGKYLEGMKCFAETDPGFPAGALYPSNKQPIQIFQWADYSAHPGTTYTYKVAALKGTPAHLTEYATCSVTVTTEVPEGDTQDVYFNRGTAASQEYVRRFGDVKPDDADNPQAVYDWLSRGLYEAICNFISSCRPGEHALRIAAYEFNYEPFVKFVKEQVARGLDIRIVYDHKGDVPGTKNAALIAKYKLKTRAKERTEFTSGIAHNKFIVKLKLNGDDIHNATPVAVLTGGTNFSRNGIFGHSNVAHVVHDEAVAGLYMNYWKLLNEDTPIDELRNAVEELTQVPPLPLPKGTAVVFSPRNSLDALQYYADLAMTAKDGLFMTFAFGMHDLFKGVYNDSTAGFRLALMEKKTRPYRNSDSEQAKKKADEAAIQKLRNKKENTFAIGNFIETNEFDGWVAEQLTGFSTNVRFIHNKFMLIDPLGNNPVVVGGSANFSAASTDKNDENMLLVRGNKRIADIYLGEFMRLFSHYSFRESLQWRSVDEQPKPLSTTDDWWKKSFGDTPNSARRKYFAQVKE